MTGYEWIHLAAEPFLPALGSKVRHDTARLAAESGPEKPQILDVGGRKSPYTIGLKADVALLDIPRQSEVQETLHLGVNDQLLAELQQKRSNIEDIYLQDMVHCTLPPESFDGVICVEVIEHVPEDEAFVEQIARVLRPDGWAYFTTPNGDYVKNEPPYYNPDHVRHYERDQLAELLSPHFGRVQVTYGIKTGKYRYRGLRSMSPRRPLATASAMVNNVISQWESRGLGETSQRTAHLFAIAYK